MRLGVTLHKSEVSLRNRWMPTTKGSRKDSHLTILGFMAASGQPLMCAIIFSAAKMKDEW
jgi:hypothetical protein